MVPQGPPVVVDDLPITQYLILDVLVARWRTGETRWTFPTTAKPALRKLAELGLVDWKSGVVYRTCIAWLTDAGLAMARSDTYEIPEVAALRAERDDLLATVRTLICLQNDNPPPAEG